jgi:hypothetical protein
VTFHTQCRPRIKRCRNACRLQSEENQEHLSQWGRGSRVSECTGETIDSICIECMQKLWEIIKRTWGILLCSRHNEPMWSISLDDCWTCLVSKFKTLSPACLSCGWMFLLLHNFMTISRLDNDVILWSQSKLIMKHIHSYSV